MYPQRHFLKPIFSLVVAGTCLLSHAAEPATPLDEVIVTATLSEELVNDVPYTAHVINQHRIHETAPQSFPEALKETPGIFIQQTAHGQGSPYIRGFTGFRTLTLIDASD